MARISKNVERDENGKPYGEIYVRRVIKEGVDKGKPYVGASTDMKHRDDNWYKENSTSYAGKKINEARKIYSDLRNDWFTEILEKVYADSDEELAKKLDEREDYWIDQLNAINNGYNSYKNSERHFSEEHCAHISKNHRDYQSEETRNKLSVAGKNHVVTDDTKRKISVGNSGKVRTTLQKAAQSARMKGVEPVAASEGLRNYVLQHGHGPTKGIKLSDTARANMKRAQESRGYDCICTFPDGHEEEFKTYSAAADAARDYIGHEINVGSVTNCIKGGGKTKDNFKFRKK